MCPCSGLGPQLLASCLALALLHHHHALLSHREPAAQGNRHHARFRWRAPRAWGATVSGGGERGVFTGRHEHRAALAETQVVMHRHCLAAHRRDSLRKEKGLWFESVIQTFVYTIPSLASLHTHTHTPDVFTLQRAIHTDLLHEHTYTHTYTHTHTHT